MLLKTDCKCCNKFDRYRCSVCHTDLGLKYPSLGNSLDHSLRFIYCPFCATSFENDRKQKIEIERKFLIEILPSYLEHYNNIENIEQRYINIDIHKNIEVRIRRINYKNRNCYYHCVKKGTTNPIIRFEYERRISQKEYDYLKVFTLHNPIFKVRYKIPYNNLIIDLDDYKRSLQQLITAEVEFKNEEEAEAFVPPDYFDREITNDGLYNNKNLIKFDELFA